MSWTTARTVLDLADSPPAAPEVWRQRCPVYWPRGELTWTSVCATPWDSIASARLTAPQELSSLPPSSLSTSCTGSLTLTLVDRVCVSFAKQEDGTKWWLCERSSWNEGQNRWQWRCFVDTMDNTDKTPKLWQSLFSCVCNSRNSLKMNGFHWN